VAGLGMTKVSSVGAPPAMPTPVKTDAVLVVLDAIDEACVMLRDAGEDHGCLWESLVSSRGALTAYGASRRDLGREVASCRFCELLKHTRKRRLRICRLLLESEVAG
jgi:hypothetical protein